ncbi:MAG: glycosyltransferase, partial [Candidatus Thorarchaeota archaeon]
LYGYLPVDSRVLREAEALGTSGYNVTVFDMDGGYEEKSLAGVREHHVMKIPLKKRITFKMLLLFWVKCLRLLLSNRASIDVVHAHDLTGLPPAAIFGFLNPRIKVIYDSHELFPEAAKEKLSFSSYIIFLGLELIFSKFVTKLISVSPIIVTALSKRIKAPAYLLMNVPNLAGIKSLLGCIPTWSDSRDSKKIRIAYSGMVLPRRGYEHLPTAAEILKTRYNTDCEIWIIGEGSFLSELKDMVKEKNLEDHFKFTGRVGFEKLLSLTADCDMAVSLYESTINNNAGLSNKIFEYMMIGVPFVFTNLTQSIPILERIGAMIISNPVSGENLADVIYSLYNNPTRMDQISGKGKHLVNSRMNWQRESETLLRVYDEL